MNSNMKITSPYSGADMFRLSRAKEVVGCVPNTLRSYHARGLPIYWQGKARQTHRGSDAPEDFNCNTITT